MLLNSSGFFDNGKFIHSRCFTHDITERQRAEEILAEANRRKDEFLATLSHELRNPLAPIRNAVQILKTISPATPTLEWCRDLIDKQVSQMARLMEDLLDLTRITRNTLELRKHPADLRAVIEGAIETSRPLIESGRHKLTVDLPGQKMTLDGDAARLMQVFANLLNNAAKYTEADGQIHVTGGGSPSGAERISKKWLLRSKITASASHLNCCLMFSRCFFKPIAAKNAIMAAWESALRWRVISSRFTAVLSKSKVRDSVKGSEFVVRLPLAKEPGERDQAKGRLRKKQESAFAAFVAICTGG